MQALHELCVQDASVQPVTSDNGPMRPIPNNVSGKSVCASYLQTPKVMGRNYLFKHSEYSTDVMHTAYAQLQSCEHYFVSVFHFNLLAQFMHIFSEMQEGNHRTVVNFSGTYIRQYSRETPGFALHDKPIVSSAMIFSATYSNSHTQNGLN